MELAFVQKTSSFFEPIEAAIKASNDDLSSPIVVVLSPQGYNRDVKVTIRRGNRTSFTSDWEGRDPTRFSARVRAAATVLMLRGYHGTFRIIHETGRLTIARA